MGNKRTSETLGSLEDPSSSYKKSRTASAPVGWDHIGSKPEVLHWVENQSSSPQKNATSDTRDNPVSLTLKPGSPVVPSPKDLPEPRKPSLGTVPASLTEKTLHDYNKANGFPAPTSTMPRQKRSIPPDSTNGSGTGESDNDPPGCINYKNSGFLNGLMSRGGRLDHQPSIQKLSNLDLLRQKISAPRESEPRDETAEAYCNLSKTAVTETEFTNGALSLITPLVQVARDGDLCMAIDLSWNREAMLAPNMVPALKALKPDRTYGFHRDAFGSGYAIDSLSYHACPIPTKQHLAFPLFTIEAKGPDGAMRDARLQNLNNGMAMVHNLAHLRGQAGTLEGFYDKFHALSAEITTEKLQLSGYWATRNKKLQVEYHGMILASWDPSTPEAFREAYRGIHNAFDWVRDQAFSWISEDLESLSVKRPRLGTPPPSTSGSNAASEVEGEVPASLKENGSSSAQYSANKL